MAYGKKYEASFNDITGVQIDVELWKDGYVGGTSSLPLAGPRPVVRRDGIEDADEFAPMRPSIVDVSLRRAGSTVLDDIYASDTGWRLRVLKNSAVHFIGPVIVEPYGQSLDDYGGEYRLSAICGLGNLQLLSIIDELEADGIADTDTKTVAGWLVYCLDKIGLGLNLLTASRYFAYGMTSGDPLTKEYIRARSWTVGGDRSLTVYDALADLLRGRGMFIHQRSGAWYAVQRRLFYASSFTTYTYASGSAATSSGSTATHTAQYSISSPRSMRAAGGQKPVRRAFVSAGVRYVHGTVENLIPNPTFKAPNIGSSEATGWTRGAGAEFVFESVGRPYTGGRPSNIGRGGRDSGVIRGEGGTVLQRVCRMPMEYLATGEDENDIPTYLATGSTLTQNVPTPFESTAIDNLLIALDCQVPLTASGAGDSTRTFFFYAYVQVKCVVGATTYYLSREKLTQEVATWGTSPAYVQVQVAANDRTEVVVKAEAPPGDGTLQIIYNAGVDTSTVEYSGGIKAADYIFWFPSSIVPVLAIDDAQHGSTEYRAAESGATGLARPAINVLTGTGPTQLHAGASLDSSSALQNDWGLDVQVSQSGLTLAEWVAYETLKQVRNPRDVIVATYRHIDVHPILAPVESGDVYLPVAAEYDYRWAMSRVEAVEVRLDGFTPDYDAVASDEVAATGGRTGEGMATLIDRFSDHVRNFSEWNALTTLSANVSGAAVTSLPIQTLSEEVAAIANGAEIAVAGLNGGVYQFTVSGAHPAPITAITVLSTDLGDAVIPAGSGVYPSTGKLTSVQTQTRNALYSSIQSGGFATVTSDTSGAAVTSIPVSAIPFDLADGWTVEIISTLSTYEGNVYTATLNGGETAGATSITIDATDIRVASGDTVRLPAVHLQSQITQNAAEIELRVTQTTYEDGYSKDALTTLTADVAGVGVTSLPVVATPHKLADNDVLIVFDSEAQTWTQVVVSGDHAAGVTAITIDSVSLNAQTGDPVKVAESDYVGQIKLNADEIVLRVTRETVIDDINNVTQTGEVAISAGKVDITGVTTFYNGNTLAENINAGTTTIDGDSITTGSVTALQIAANTITAAEIAANTITAAEIAAGTITTTEIAAGTITASNIAAGTITATEIAAATITADRLSVSTLEAVAVNTGALTIQDTLTISTGGEIVVGSNDVVIDTDGLRTGLGVGLGTYTADPSTIFIGGADGLKAWSYLTAGAVHSYLINEAALSRLYIQGEALVELACASGPLGVSAATTLTLTNSTGSYVWPTSAPAVDGYILSSTTGGVMSWIEMGGGDVSKVGTPVDNQIGVWTGDGTIEGDAALTFDTTTDTLRMLAATPSVNTANDSPILRIEGITDVAAIQTSLGWKMWADLTDTSEHYLAYLSGISDGVVDSSLYYSSSTDTWTFTDALTVGGLMTAERAYLQGSATQLSLAHTDPADNAQFLVVSDGNLQLYTSGGAFHPTTHAGQDLGTTSRYWGILYATDAYFGLGGSVSANEIAGFEVNGGSGTTGGSVLDMKVAGTSRYQVYASDGVLSNQTRMFADWSWYGNGGGTALTLDISAAEFKFSKGIGITGGAAPSTAAGVMKLYADTEDLPKAYVGTSGPAGVGITWATMYSRRTFASNGGTEYVFDSGTKRGTHTMPASHFVAGQTYRVFASGENASNSAALTMTWSVRAGSTAIASKALTLDANATWVLDGMLVVSAFSTTATLVFDGTLTWNDTVYTISGSQASIAAGGIDLDVALAWSGTDTDTIYTDIAVLQQLY